MINNKNIKFDWEFKLSLLADLVRVSIGVYEITTDFAGDGIPTQLKSWCSWKVEVFQLCYQWTVGAESY